MWRIATLLAPRLRGQWNRWQRAGRTERIMTVVFAGVAAFFWIGLVVGATLMIDMFYGVEVFGPILTRKLLEILLLSLFGLLIFSNIITALSTFYLSDDLELVLSLPVSRVHFHFARLLDVSVQTSWMMGFFGIPLVIAYGITHEPGVSFYLVSVVVALVYAAIPPAIGVIVASTLVTVFPARRIRELLAFAGIMVLAGLIVLVRFLRPERLLDPESFDSLAAYVAELQNPVPLMLPPRWAAEVMVASLTGRPFPWVLFGLLVTGAVATVAISRWLTDAMYDTGRSKAQEARAARLAKNTWFDALIRAYVSPVRSAAGAVVTKDIKTFFRDATQWSQLFVLGSILAIALTSVAAFPMDTFRGPYMGAFRNMLAYLDLGLVGFVMAAIAARFQFTAVSAEGRGFWIVRTGPITARQYLWSKVYPGILPMLITGEILAVASTIILGAGPFLIAVSTWLAFCLAFSLSAIAIALGAVYADFKLDNAARISAGPAGMLFMVSATTVVAIMVAIFAGPVYLHLNALYAERPLTSAETSAVVAAFVVTGVLGLITTVVPVNVAAKVLWDRELPNG